MEIISRMGDLASPLFALGSALLAVFKDQIGQTPRGKRVVMFLAIAIAIGALVSTIRTLESNRESAKASSDKITELGKSLVETRRQLDAANASLRDVKSTGIDTKRAAGQILDEVSKGLPAYVKGSLNTLGESLATQVNTATTKAADASAGKARESIDKAADRLSSTINESSQKVEAAVGDVQKATKALSEAIANSGEQVHEQILSTATQVPLRLLQDRVSRLTGRLEKLSLNVGDVSTTKSFFVNVVPDAPTPSLRVTCPNGSAPDKEQKCWFDPKQKMGPLKLVYDGKNYDLELVPDAASSVVGEQPDYLIVRIVQR